MCSTFFPDSCISFDSYIKPQRQSYMQESTMSCISFDSYIKPQLGKQGRLIDACCISFDSYIKPQPYNVASAYKAVVYLLIPTSNHNRTELSSVFIVLYIFWFLHQTTTCRTCHHSPYSCISFDSYIKPQPALWSFGDCTVVYLLIPTSNHNISSVTPMLGIVVYLLIPTSNHNLQLSVSSTSRVVYLLIPTSNHNLKIVLHRFLLLYIFWFLHQTTTA